MTNKQIIIEDCPYQGECSVSGCKRNDDGCFVRQLFEERYRAENQIVELNKTIQAKEQKCEELKENLPNAITRLMGELDQLKAENEKIEQCIIEQNRLVVGMTKEIVTLTFKKYELLQALTEIKELLLKTPTDSQMYCANAKSVILQKISEVEK